MIHFWLFAEGFISLTYQLLFFRLLEPVVGSSSEVNGWIIGAFLGALSLGYKQGGKVLNEPMLKLGRNFIYSMLAASLFMSSLLIHVYFESLLGFGLPRIVILIAYCIFGVAPIAYFMGQSLPLLIQKSAWGNSPSEKGGNALFMSTLGSMAGAIIPTTFFLPAFGATITLAINTIFALLLGVLLVYKKSKILIVFAISFQVLMLVPYAMLSEEALTSTAYSDIALIRDDDELKMYANGLTMSSQDLQGNNESAYIEHFQDEVLNKKIKNENFLILGAGGFMAHTRNEGNNNFTYVDIDGALVDWATKFFNFDKELVDVEIDDARSFLLSQPNKKWKLILVDTFSSRFSMPEHLVTKEFFELAKSKLKDDGYMVVNAAISPLYQTAYSRKLHSTILSVFPFCHITQVTQNNDMANVSYWCFVAPKEQGVYTDDKHNVSRDVWKANTELANKYNAK